MTDSSIFELQIAKFIEKAEGNVDLVFRKVALEMFTRVVIKSPVDEGRFKSSYVVSIDTIPTGIPDTIDKSGAPSFARIKAAVLDLKAGHVITMCSNLEYARPLEYGHSKQAPNGMVRLTIAEWNSVVNKAVSELPK